MFASPKELLPHAGWMNWLERVEAHTTEITLCRARIPASSPLSAADGSLPGFGAIELMAQCSAAHAALERRRPGEASDATRSPRRILLLGTRAIELSRERFFAGELLEVEARSASFASNGLAVMACSVRDSAGNELARARLNLLSQP